MHLAVVSDICIKINSWYFLILPTPKEVNKQNQFIMGIGTLFKVFLGGGKNDL